MSRSSTRPLAVIVSGGVIGLALAAQIIGATRFEARRLRELPHDWRRFSLDRADASPEDLDAEVYRFMGRFTPYLPEDAAVLVLSGVVRPLSYELYLVPRRTELLFRFDPEIVARAARLDPAQRAAVTRRFEYLEEHGLRLTPDRLQAATARAAYVIRHRLEWTDRLGPDLEARGFEPVMSCGAETVLWRRREGR